MRTVNKRASTPEWTFSGKAAGLGLAAILLMGLLIGPAAPAWADAAPAVLLEELHYRIDVPLLRDALRARLTLKQLDGQHYQAEINSELQGALKELQGQRRDRYLTDMCWQNGRLMPTVYREQSLRQGKKHLKEYRFDYVQKRLELWQWKEGKGLVRKWEGPLNEPIYDPLTAFYNCRLGVMGPVQEGSTIKIRGIPYPKPEEIEVRFGGKTAEGQKAMVTIIGPHQGGQGEVFALLDPQKVPIQAWTSFMGLGQIRGELLPGSRPMKDSLMEHQK